MTRFLIPLILLGACTSDTSSADTSSADTVAADTVTADTTAHADTADAVDTVVAADTSTRDTVPADTTPPFALPAPDAIGGKTRPATVIVPSTYDGRSPLPAVFLLGGYFNFAWELDEWIELSDHVDDKGFVLVLPDGTVDEDDAPFWNATDTCCDYYDTGVDDVAYLAGLLDELTDKVHIDPARVTLVGHSNGGFMAYRMACEIPERVAAIVSIAGSGWRSETACGATTPVSVLQVHGLDDETMPFAGDSDAPGALEMTRRWGARAGCDTDSWTAQTDRMELSDDEVANETAVSTFERDCQSGYDVVLWAMTGNDHYPDFRPVFGASILDWALAHSQASGQ